MLLAVTYDLNIVQLKCYCCIPTTYRYYRFCFYTPHYSISTIIVERVPPKFQFTSEFPQHSKLNRVKVKSFRNILGGVECRKPRNSRDIMRLQMRHKRWFVSCSLVEKSQLQRGFFSTGPQDVTAVCRQADTCAAWWESRLPLNLRTPPALLFICYLLLDRAVAHHVTEQVA